MRRHDFDPGKLVIGLVLLGGGLAYLAAADSRVHFPSYLLLPVMAAGLCVAGVVSSLAFTVRRHRTRGADPAAGRPRDDRPDRLS
ncbi:hypothetical protein [Streptomyces sp. NPDC053048]|uniref:hypothetical protein n=1 Tax=Streptomyces sp. NPDC053048 TaxID=3365694 RepID=UPI0037D26EDC